MGADTSRPDDNARPQDRPRETSGCSPFDCCRRRYRSNKSFACLAPEDLRADDIGVSVGNPAPVRPWAPQVPPPPEQPI